MINRIELTPAEEKYYSDIKEIMREIQLDQENREKEQRNFIKKLKNITGGISMNDEELERKKKYDELLEQYVRIIETGESQEDDNSTYIKRICESIVSLGIAMCDFDNPVQTNLYFISHMIGHIHKALLEIIPQCYEEDPDGETHIGHFDVEGLKEWRKDNEM